MTDVLRVLVADDHEIVRRGLLDLLCEEFGQVETAEASNGAEVLAALRQGQWDLLLLDISMPDTDVIDVLTRARKVAPELPILILTAVREVEYVVQTMRAGANGVMHKHRVAEELVTAIRTVVAGGQYLHPETALEIASAVREPEQPAHDNLSDRELEVLRLVAVGKSIKEAAASLHLSEKTVATYLSRIREKTGLRSLVEIARYALKTGLVD